jgi:quercetin dioxygenase-like cupin family protein
MQRLNEAVYGSRSTSRNWIVAGAAFLGTLLVSLMLVLGPPGERAEADHGGSQLLARGGFVDDVSGHLKYRLEGTSATRIVHLADASDMVVVKVTLDPDGVSDWHSHPGPGLIAVAEGTITITYAEDCVPRPYSAGDAFMEPGNVVMRADNFGDTDAIVYVTFLGIPDGPPSVPFTGEDPCT